MTVKRQKKKEKKEEEDEEREFVFQNIRRTRSVSVNIKDY